MQPLPSSQQHLSHKLLCTELDISSINCRIAEVKKCIEELKSVKHKLKLHAPNSNSIQIKEITKLSIERGGTIHLLKNSLSYATEELRQKSEQVVIRRQSRTDITQLYRFILFDQFLVKPIILNNLNLKFHAIESKEPYYCWILKFKFDVRFFLRVEYNFKHFKLLAMKPQPKNFKNMQRLLEETNDISGLLYTFKKYLDHISSNNCENMHKINEET